MAYKRTILSVAVALSLLPYAASAGAPVPSSENLIQLKINIQENPENLDHYFEFATMAMALGEYKQAEEAYLHMLKVNPSLERVKLELGLVYLRSGQFRKAKLRFEDVLTKQPPENVRKNIDKVMLTVIEGLKSHLFNVSLATGFNYDSNANSAASSGFITFQDTSIPLQNNSLSKNDGQAFGAATFSHSYRLASAFAENYNMRWNSSTTFYRTEQANIDALNLLLVNIKTGPVMYLNNNRTQLSLNSTYNYIALDQKDYLTITAGEFGVVHKLSDRLSWDASVTSEHRHFINSPVALVTPRTGNALQGKTGLTYAITDKDILNTAFTWRSEKSRQEYYDNTQLQLSGSYTRLLPYDCFANTALAVKSSKYDAAEPIISATTIREDKERTAGLTLGKRFKNNVTWTIGYQYKKISSSLQNYDYTNKRISTAIGWNF